MFRLLLIVSFSILTLGCQDNNGSSDVEVPQELERYTDYSSNDSSTPPPLPKL